LKVKLDENLGNRDIELFREHDASRSSNAVPPRPRRPDSRGFRFGVGSAANTSPLSSLLCEVIALQPSGAPIRQASLLLPAEPGRLLTVFD
jgi:hypothetical protein